MSTISDALPFGLRDDVAVLAALREGGRTDIDAVPGTRASWAGGFRRHASDFSDGFSPAGLNALFDRYHQWLYGLYMRTLRDHENATLALGQALGSVAAARLTRPEQLRPAAARAAYESGLRVGEGRSRVTRVRRVPDTTTQLLVGIMDAGGDGELRRLVWRAMETLSYRERLLFELEWHDRLDVRELVTVIGGRNGQAVLNRARDRIRATLTTAVAVWYGSERCMDLRRLVRHAGASEGRPGTMRGVIDRHLYGTRAEPPCEICLDSQDKYALPVLGAALPVFGVPDFLREHAIEIALEYRHGLRSVSVEHGAFAVGAGSLGAGPLGTEAPTVVTALAGSAAAETPTVVTPIAGGLGAEAPTVVTPIAGGLGAEAPTVVTPTVGGLEAALTSGYGASSSAAASSGAAASTGAAGGSGAGGGFAGGAVGGGGSAGGGFGSGAASSVGGSGGASAAGPSAAGPSGAGAAGAPTASVAGMVGGAKSAPSLRGGAKAGADPGACGPAMSGATMPTQRPANAYSGSPWGAPEELPPSNAYPAPAPPRPSNVVPLRRKRVAAGAVAAAAAVLFSFSAVMLAQNQTTSGATDVLAAATPRQIDGDTPEQGPSPIGDPPDSQTDQNEPEPDNYQIDTNAGNERPAPIPEPRTTEPTSSPKPTTPSKTPPGTKPTTPTPAPSTTTPPPTPPTTPPDDDPTTTPPDDDPTTTPPDDDPTTTPLATPAVPRTTPRSSPLVVPA